jgi:ABC-type nickel/cobalt efflux system permease component RcnA
MISGLIQGVIVIGLLIAIGAMSGHAWAMNHRGWAIAWASAGFLIGLIAWLLVPPVAPGKPGGATMEIIHGDEDEKRFIEKYK